ncbi:hypothetical protein XENOCAPTIV_030895 [Xenoophorus captivus]|uniref:Secreted protein n=1 Tax=Xenoophorus captivus TaxID=1517983 RepID=A0ABV0RXR0_9TELE
MAGRVGASGVLLAVLPVARGLQSMVRTCKGHLHDCWQKAPSCSKTKKTLFVSVKSLRFFFPRRITVFCSLSQLHISVVQQLAQPGRAAVFYTMAPCSERKRESYM